MNRPARILYYNWVDYLDDERRGGGVSVYQRSLMLEMKECAGVEATFLSAGLSHDLLRKAPRWERLRHGPEEDRARRFEIVNSGVLSPGHHSFGARAQVDHPATVAAVADFIEATGPYDVIHFNNLEGLPVSVLSLKERWPETRVILSLHNYYPICPQVNLWRQERKTCADFDDGRRCATCLPHVHDPRFLRLANAVAYRLKTWRLRPGGRVFGVLFHSFLLGVRILRARAGRSGSAQVADGAVFAARRKAMIAAINTHCDAVLCVSDAVRKLVVGYGVRPEIAQTSYIGAREAAVFERTAPRAFPLRADGTLTLAYLGYMRRDKGFYFLLDALEAMPVDLARRLRLVAAAGRSDGRTTDRLLALAPKLASLEHVDGYSHAELDALLESVDVGLIPVLWHDNLPQVAIEMHARHIPLLTADLGGAQELGRCAEMAFPAGDIGAFHARIAALLEGRVDMARYWRGAMAPVGMAAHLEDLMQHYRISPISQIPNAS